MGPEIKTISLSFPHNLGAANCYLIKTGAGYILIDTGFANKRAELEKELESAGCRPGNLNLIVLTHGDGDHSGNCAYLREKYGAKTAIHPGESGMVESGNAFLSRKKKNLLKRIFDRIILGILSPLVNLGRFETFKPDLTIGEGYDLSPYGLAAEIIHIPGHSKGSIGILTSGGELFYGDLLWNNGKPSVFPNIDEIVEVNASIEKLKTLNIKTVYPGHGRPFALKEFLIARMRR